MKASLMVGDLVKVFDRYPARVERILDTEVYLLDGDGVRWHVPYSFIRPIPITTDLLEKNGFAKSKNSKRSSYQFIDSQTYAGWWNGRLNLRYNTDPCNRPTNYIFIDCKYVHQLRHAFQLAGVEKEIVI